MKFTKGMQKKLVILFMLILLAFVILIGRITYINASEGENYTKIVLDQQQYTSRTIPFKRGDIVDSNGTKFATSERVYNVILDAKVLLSNEKKAETYKQATTEALQTYFGIEAETVLNILEEGLSASAQTVTTRSCSKPSRGKATELQGFECVSWQMPQNNAASITTLHGYLR